MKPIKLKYFYKTTHIKTEIRHTYPQAHPTLYKKDKDQTAAPIQKAPVPKAL